MINSVLYKYSKDSEFQNTIKGAPLNNEQNNTQKL